MTAAIRVGRLVLAVVVVVTLAAGVGAADPATVDPDEDLTGSGIAGDPYTVTNVSELQAIAGNLSAHYELGNDIDASETTEWNNGSGFDPIGNSTEFSGTFSGSGHTISELYINRSSEDGVGLFGVVDGGAIENVRLNNVTVSGSNWVGGLVGQNSGTVSESSTTGSVDGSLLVGGLIGQNSGTVSESSAASSVDGSVVVGGLVGDNTFGVVRTSSATGSVAGSNQIGGLVGQNNGKVHKSSATGRVEGANQIGGLIGQNPFGEVKESFATGSVEGASDVGGLVGTNLNGTVTNTYATGTVTATTENLGGLVGNNTQQSSLTASYAVGRVSDEQSPTNAGGLVGTNEDSATIENAYWDIGTTTQYDAVGSSDATETNLVGLGESSNTDLANEIRGINATVHMHGLDFDETWRPGTPGAPDLAWDSEFDTTVDVMAGDGDTTPYAITTVYELQAMRYDPAANYMLATDVDATRTQRWFEDGGDPRGFDPIGDRNTGFTGRFNGSGHTISELYITRHSEDRVGLFGTVSSGTVEHVTLEAVSVDGTDSVGALVGYNTGEVRGSSATGSVDGTDSVGGLVGTNSIGEVEESFATGSVEGASDVGGLVGTNLNGTVTNTYATGTVTATTENLGGLVGNNTQQSSLTASYAIGRVSDERSPTNAGGLVGTNDDSAIIENAYWDIGLTTRSDAVGNSDAIETNLGGFGESSDTDIANEMQGINATVYMYGFDFDKTWRPATSGAPDLAWDSEFELSTDILDGGTGSDSNDGADGLVGTGGYEATMTITDETPGFGVPIAVVSLLRLALLTGRRTS